MSDSELDLSEHVGNTDDVMTIFVFTVIWRMTLVVLRLKTSSLLVTVKIKHLKPMKGR